MTLSLNSLSLENIMDRLEILSTFAINNSSYSSWGTNACITYWSFNVYFIIGVLHA